jgi:hypothetical protein
MKNFLLTIRMKLFHIQIILIFCYTNTTPSDSLSADELVLAHVFFDNILFDQNNNTFTVCAPMQLSCNDFQANGAFTINPSTTKAITLGSERGGKITITSGSNASDAISLTGNVQCNNNIACLGETVVTDLTVTGKSDLLGQVNIPLQCNISGQVNISGTTNISGNVNFNNSNEAIHFNTKNIYFDSIKGNKRFLVIDTNTGLINTDNGGSSEDATFTSVTINGPLTINNNSNPVLSVDNQNAIVKLNGTLHTSNMIKSQSGFQIVNNINSPTNTFFSVDNSGNMTVKGEDIIFGGLPYSANTRFLVIDENGKIGLSASSDSTDPVFTSVTINNGSLKLKNSNSEEVFLLDSSGNITSQGNVSLKGSFTIKNASSSNVFLIDKYKDEVAINNILIVKDATENDWVFYSSGNVLNGSDIQIGLKAGTNNSLKINNLPVQTSLASTDYYLAIHSSSDANNPNQVFFYNPARNNIPSLFNIFNDDHKDILSEIHKKLSSHKNKNENIIAEDDYVGIILKNITDTENEVNILKKENKILIKKINKLIDFLKKNNINCEEVKNESIDE